MIRADQIPPEVVEAAARAAMKDNSCGYTVNGQHVLCCDPVCEGLVDCYGYPLLNPACSCRSMALASIAAALSAWPGAAVCHYTIANTEGWEMVLPLPEAPQERIAKQEEPRDE